MSWFKMLVRWLRNPEVDRALNESERRLDITRKEHEAIKPELKKLNEHIAHNHFERSVSKIFRVVD